MYIGMILLIYMQWSRKWDKLFCCIGDEKIPTIPYL